MAAMLLVSNPKVAVMMVVGFMVSGEGVSRVVLLILCSQNLRLPVGQEFQLRDGRGIDLREEEIYLLYDHQVDWRLLISARRTSC